MMVIIFSAFVFLVTGQLDQIKHSPLFTNRQKLPVFDHEAAFSDRMHTLIIRDQSLYLFDKELKEIKQTSDHEKTIVQQSTDQTRVVLAILEDEQEQIYQIGTVGLYQAGNDNFGQAFKENMVFLLTLVRAHNPSTEEQFLIENQVLDEAGNIRIQNQQFKDESYHYFFHSKEQKDQQRAFYFTITKNDRIDEKNNEVVE